MTRLILLLAYLALATSCASITRGSTESFAIETTPTDAEVTVTHTGGEEQCTSPCLVEVKRKGHLMIKIVKEGYKVHTTTIQSSIDGGGKAGMAGNLILGGLIGAGVDAGTGAMHSHKPNPLVVELEPDEP